MTDNQRKYLYFPAWNRAFKANWRTERGTVVAVPQPANVELAAKVADLGEAIAKREARALKADDLRHAAEMLALHKSVSSSQMTEAEIDKCLATFRLLANEVHVASVIVQQRTLPDRTRMEWAALNHPFGRPYVEAVCNGKFGTRNIRGLSDRQLSHLLMTLKSREQSRRRKGQTVGPTAAKAPTPATATKTGRTYQLQPAEVSASKDFDPYAGETQTVFGTRRGD